jgi:hypothetical protein
VIKVINIDRFREGLVFTYVIDYNSKVYHDDIISALLDSKIEFNPGKTSCFHGLNKRREGKWRG